MPWLWWLWSSLAAPAPVATLPPPRACGVVGPSEQDLQQWLSEHQDSNDDRWRMRLSALAPQLMVGAHTTADHDLQTDKQPGTAESVQQDQGTGQRFEAQLRWQLSELIFHPRELESQRNRSKAAQQQQDRQLTIIEHFYARIEQRQRCLVATDDDEALTARRESHRLGTTLQVLTSGWFLSPPQPSVRGDWDN